MIEGMAIMTYNFILGVILVLGGLIVFFPIMYIEVYFDNKKRKRGGTKESSRNISYIQRNGKIFFN